MCTCIFCHWDDTDAWNTSLEKTKTCLSNIIIVNAITIVHLITQGARSSTAMVLILSSKNILASELKRLICECCWIDIKLPIGNETLEKTCLYSERPRGAGFRSVNPAERWRENPARALARAGFSQHLEYGIHRSESSSEGFFALIPHPVFSQHLECGIHRSESSPEGFFALIPHPVARWANTTP